MLGLRRCTVHPVTGGALPSAEELGKGNKVEAVTIQHAIQRRLAPGFRIFNGWLGLATIQDRTESVFKAEDTYCDRHKYMMVIFDPRSDSLRDFTNNCVRQLELTPVLDYLQSKESITI